MQAQASVKDLGLKDLSLKLVLLLALTSAARAHEIAALDMQFLTEKGDSWEFSLAIHVKQSRPNHPSRRIYLPAYPVNEKLCVVTTRRNIAAGRSAFVSHQNCYLHWWLLMRPYPARPCQGG